MAVGGLNWSGCRLECLEWNYDNTVIINLIVHLRRRLPKYYGARITDGHKLRWHED